MMISLFSLEICCDCEYLMALFKGTAEVVSNDPPFIKLNIHEL